MYTCVHTQTFSEREGEEAADEKGQGEGGGDVLHVIRVYGQLAGAQVLLSWLNFGIPGAPAVLTSHMRPRLKWPKQNLHG